MMDIHIQRAMSETGWATAFRMHLMGLTSVFLCLASSEKDWLPAALLPHTETMRQGEGEREREREREGGRGMREWEVDEGEWKSKRREPERFWRRRPINVEISPRIWWNGCVLAINGFQLPKGGRGERKCPIEWLYVERGGRRQRKG